MTRTVILLIALYLLWRIATLMGRMRDREYRQRQRRFGVKTLVRCSRCGAYVAEEDVTWQGSWPLRKAVCKGGCGVASGGDGQVE